MRDADPPHSLFDWPAPGERCASGRLCVLGAPTDQGNAISRGAALAPAAIRRAACALPPPRIGGYDLGDLGRDAGGDPATYLDRLALATADVIARGLCPLTLGGDHSITYAPVSMLQREQDIALIWFDAHTDFSPWSGPAAHDHKQVLRRISRLDGVRRIVQIGYRGITVGDERQLGERATVVTSARARTLDANALLALIPADLPCYVSIDIDAIDPLWAPGTSAPVPDGLLPAEVRDLLRALVRHRRLVGLDLVEVNPRLDLNAATSAVAAGLIHALAQEWEYQCAPEPGSDRDVADVRNAGARESPPSPHARV